MIVATHRVVGVLEWPIDSEPTPEMLTVMNHDPLLGDLPNGHILSLRVPVPNSQATVLAADVPQLRRDLHRLFQDFTAAP
jgi:hypothetical protein